MTISFLKGATFRSVSYMKHASHRKLFHIKVTNLTDIIWCW